MNASTLSDGSSGYLSLPLALTSTPESMIKVLLPSEISMLDLPMPLAAPRNLIPTSLVGQHLR